MGKTRGVHETTLEVRNRMVGMYEAGLGLREIAAAVNCSQRTVKRWLNRFDKEGNVETRERCGRKRATTAEQDDAIIQLASQTSITAAKAVLPALGLSCSVDTIRDRLHKAGIHNWSPSRKHMQRIPLRSTDSAGIQQAVWRPTGTQHGKKKVYQGNKSKKILTCTKKTSNKDKTSNNNYVNTTDNFTQPTEEDLSAASKRTNNIIPPGQSGNIFSHSMPTLQVSQCWPLDLVQNNNDMSQRPVSNFRELLNTNHQEIQPESVQQCRNKDSKENKKCQDHYQDILENQMQYMTNCSNSQMDQDVRINKYYTPENDEGSSIENNINSCGVSSDSQNAQKCKSDINNKKGGKLKGTLETTIEIRNRMIGMSEAGLSTLSIALAINRSERTVKRWLERWRKEGNVQTKERKGRRRITTKEEDDAIVAMATQQPLTAAKHVAPALGLKCSVDTIRERLHKAGIHSWKLGKKQGEGNAVHTIHLWQPSGNRPNKLKPSNKKKKRCVRRKEDLANNTSETGEKEKKNLDNFINKVACESQKIIEEQNNDIQFVSYTSAPPVTSQAADNISMPNTALIESQTMQQLTSSTQQMAILGPTITHQTEPHCRLICSNAQSTIPCHSSANPIYPSNSVIINNHHGHMEHSDTISYEPYIWTF